MTMTTTTGLNHNHAVFNYCPKCSGPAPLFDSRKIVCSGCGFKLYLNVAAAVAALIFDGDGRLMVIRRNHDPRRGFLDLPGGFADFGETGESALRREIFEELGIDVSADRFEYCRSIPNVYEYSGITYHTLDLFYACRIDDLPDVRPNSEIMEVLYRHPKDISLNEIAFESMRNFIGGMNDHAVNGGNNERSTQN